ncbi:PTS lactose/cellobiose transporter subunit IIA [Lactiplantibacillus sp. WILCCON 0030]|uniref:PTS lactose/cellobiose transporter subunit IIA n=1 Tax=Lactiplantibacillus brownii TaxID=3069269 RepID=A0ABU1AC79_9LACO|nr:PTS lactose/cellobiose transporter subunit IIA [Lactiplantibacillus brownii]MDQ7938559.1 PTS lactose/cellobiose transporter subunit IIA [Lactiplantibacillus brownii]
MKKIKEEPLNDDLDMLSMNILVHAGNTRDAVVKALEAIEQQKYSLADELLATAHQEIVIAHGLQTDTLQEEANGNQIRYSTLFCHAQDTLMTAQSELLIADHLEKIVANITENK